MAKSRFIQNSCLSGELSTLMYGNISLQQYYNGLSKAENVVIVPQGGVKRRGGLKMVASDFFELEINSTVPTMPNGGTPSVIVDDDSATTTTTNVMSGNTFVIAHYDLVTSLPPFCKFVVRNISIGSGIQGNFRIQISQDNTNWTNLYLLESLSTTPQDFDYFTFLSNSYLYRYVRLAFDDIQSPVSTTVTLGEFHIVQHSSTVSNVKLFEFNSELGIPYLGAISDKICYIYKKSGESLSRLEVLDSVYSSAEIPDVRVSSLDNVALMFHESHAPQRLVNYGDSSAASNGGASKNPGGGEYWTLGAAPFTNIPQFDFNDSLSPSPTDEIQDISFSNFTLGMTYQVDVEGVLSKQITFAGDGNADQQQSTEENLRKNLQDMPVFGDTGISVSRTGGNTYRITISGESTKNFRLFSGFNTTGSTTATVSFSAVQNGVPRKEDVWSANRGYPRTGAFHGGRLWIGGTRDKRSTLISSKSGDLLNFDTGEGADDDGIFITLSSSRISDITNIFSGRTLQIFTKSSEYAFVGDSITPATISGSLKVQTSNGSLPVDPQEADGAVVFADNNGKTLREFIYSFNEDSYEALDISVLSSHLIKSPVAMAYQTGTSSEDANWLFGVNADGSGFILNKLRSQDINGFVSFSSGLLKDVQSFNDDIVFVVERTINGATKRFIEMWDFDYRLDASMQITYQSGYDLAHLIGEEVQVLKGNIIYPSRTVLDNGTGRGIISFSAEEQAIFQFGDILEIGFNFEPVVKTMPLNTSIGSGDNAMRLKRIVRMNVRVNETLGLQMDGNEIPDLSFGGDVLDQEPAPFTGILDDLYPSSGWGRDHTVEFKAVNPTPMHIQSMEFEVESS